MIIENAIDKRGIAFNGVSVIVTCHNYGIYLADCLNSIFNQTYKPLEIILVDDKSVDNTKSISSHYDLKYHNVNFGSPNESRKFGFNKSNGDWVLFVDADDMLTSDYIQKMIEAVDEFHDVIYCNVQEFGESKNYYNCNHKSAITSKFNFCHISCLVRRKAIIESDVFGTPNENKHEDSEFWKRLMNHGCKFKKSSSVFLYRKHGKSRSNQD